MAMPGQPPGSGPTAVPTAGFTAPVNVAKLKREEIRRHLKVAQQLKVGTLVIIAILLLAAYPVYLFTRSVAQDPVFDDLDALDLPSWAMVQHSDAAVGSRWCIGNCRFRERTWASERKPEETIAAYEQALGDAGWRLRPAQDCPTVTDGTSTCWQRDEYVMDMWVRAPICDVPPPRPSLSAKPAANASPTPTSPSPVENALACPGALVTVRVFYAITYQS